MILHTYIDEKTADRLRRASLEQSVTMERLAETILEEQLLRWDVGNRREPSQGKLL